METHLIYLVTNNINQKKYVGQTKTGRLDRRLWEHLQDAKITEKNVAFHNAINKYGIENFSIEVIEDNISPEQIDDRERFWIAYYNTYIHAEDSQGYNETIGGQGTYGYVLTETDRAKISAKQKSYWAELPDKDPEEYQRLCEIRRKNKLGYKWTEESRQKLNNSCKGRSVWNKGLKGVQKSKFKNTSKYPAVRQYNLDTGVFIKSFSSIYTAAEETLSGVILSPDAFAIKRLSRSGRIFSVCQAKKGHAYGYIWRFEPDYLDITQLSSEELAKESRSPRAKAIVQLDLSGEIINEFESAAAYSKTCSNNYEEQRQIAKCVNYVCLGKAKTYKGHIWKFKE